MRKRTQARECALQILYRIEMNPVEPAEAIAAFWLEEEQPEEVREFVALLVNGTCEHLQAIDLLIKSAAQNWDLERMAVIDRNILRAATFEILHLDDIPPKVIINEAVNMAKKFSQEESGKFVNGILDKIAHTEKPGRFGKSDGTSEGHARGG